MTFDDFIQIQHDLAKLPIAGIDKNESRIYWFWAIRTVDSPVLGQDFEIIAFDKLDKKNEMLELGVKSGTLEDVCQQSVVIPFVPISEFEGLIKQIAPMVNPSALILDVCSVKAHPVQAMKAYLPESVSIIGTHPMFGPDSAKDSLFGKKIVLCPVRVEKNSLIKLKISCRPCNECD